LYVHNPATTLMRTTREECVELGTRLARRLSASRGPATLFLPLRGVSAISVEGGAFYDADADAALFDAIRAELDRDRVELIELELAVNDTDFATAMTDRLYAQIKSAA
jgi:uncharacterized protein (UPF0261 family)